MAHLTVLVFLSAFLVLAAAEPSLVYRTDDGEDLSEGPRKVVLLNYGSASSSLTFFYKGGNVAATKFSEGNLYTAGEPVSAATGEYTNYTIPLTFERSVGTEPYKFEVTTSAGISVSIEGKFVVAGFVVYDNDQVVSGDDGAGIVVGADGSYTYDVKAVGTDGSEATMTDVVIDYAETSGPYFKEVNTASISSSSFILKLNKYRVGTGSFTVNFDAPSIAVDGEIFETSLNVKQEVDSVPPCVAVGGDYEIDSDGYVAVEFYNLASPPRDSPVSEIVMKMGGKSYDFVSTKSKMDVPDQLVYFMPGAAGEVSFTCDGEDAMIVGADAVTITGAAAPRPDGPLAKDTVQSLDGDDNLATLVVRISVVNSDPTLLSAADAKAIASEVCDVTGAKGCVYTAIVKGSAVITIQSQTERDEADAAVDKLSQSFDSCSFHKGVANSDYACEDLELLESQATAPKAVTSVITPTAGAGLATWAIALIASVGAFVVILLFVVAMWAVYRRNAEQSESDYSSSGPLGVPDPSDLLYEQSIVRDIYGRGDFPEGGPSAAAAEARAREADLREEFPRPPSSSGVSRGAGTDDASSTYSV